MKATELLKAEHDKVEELFAQVEAAEESKHEALFVKIKDALDPHAHIEETIFYPKMIADGNEELQSIVKEGIEEHRQMKMFLKEIAALSTDADKFEAKLKVLMEDTRHHVKEEEGEMFPLVEKQFPADVLEELGAAMAAEEGKFKKAHAATSSGS
ncbi:MAG: hemerythrin domain-containing protein [Acidobacteriota bacterium]